MWHGFHHIVFTFYIAYSHSIVPSSQGLSYSASFISTWGVMLPFSCVHLINLLLHLYLCIALRKCLSRGQTALRERRLYIFFPSCSQSHYCVCSFILFLLFRGGTHRWHTLYNFVSSLYFCYVGILWVYFHIGLTCFFRPELKRGVCEYACTCTCCISCRSRS